MPYASNSELPKYLQKYSKKLKDLWRGVFNSAYTKYQDEAKAFTIANGTIKKQMEKHGAIDEFGYEQIFNYQTDKFLGVLK